MYLYMKKAQESRSHAVGPSQVIAKFEVTFDRYTGNVTPSIRPGDTIQGKVTYLIATGTQPKGLKLQLIGDEKVNWFDQKEHSTKRFLTLDVETRSVVGVEGKYKFRVIVPPKLPQSYTGKQGSIRYWIEPVFGEGILTAISASTRHEGKLNTKQRNDFLKKYRTPIKILPFFDLSAYPSLHLPMVVMKDNSGVFTSKNLIEIILSLPKLGYVSNETIEFDVHIINGSDKAITSSVITLVQEAKFRAGPINRQEVKTLYEETGPQMTTKACEAWHGKIKIPSKVSPISTRCSFICVDYYLRAAVTSTGFMETVEAKVPIVIGTVSTSGVDANEALTGASPSTAIPLSSSMESLASQVTYCSHGYLDRSCCDEDAKLPNYDSLAASLSKVKIKTDDDWETMSFSSLPAYEAVAGSSGSKNK